MYRRASRALFLAAAVALSSASTAWADAPRCVLLLHSFGNEVTPLDTFTANFRAALTANMTPQVEVFDVSLQPTPFEVDDRALLHYLRATLTGHTMDLVVPTGGPAVAFAQRHRRELFPSTPMLIAAVDPLLVDTASLTPQDAVVAIANDPASMVDGIVQLLPNINHLFVVVGASPIEQFWRDAVSREAERFAGRITFAYSDQLSFSEMLATAASLPPDSAIFFVLWSIDATGAPYSEDQALSRLHAVANAPIFGINSTQLGRGIVGGPVMDIDRLSLNAAMAAKWLLHGESPAAVRLPVQKPGPVVFDVRELRRWGIPDSRLPADSVVRFLEPTVWQRFRWPIVTATSILSAQMLLIVMLVSNHRKRRDAEAALAQLNRRLIRAQEEERAWVARELHDDVGQRIAAASWRLEAVARDLSDEHSGQVRAVGRDVSEIAHAVQAVSHRLHSAKTELLGLAASIGLLCRDIVRSRSIDVTFRQFGDATSLRAETSLALFRIVQEALQNAVKHSGARHVVVILSESADRVDLTVVDDGSGFDVAAGSRGTGLGLLAMRERMALVNGTLRVESRSGSGTTIRASVPRDGVRMAANGIEIFKSSTARMKFISRRGSRHKTPVRES